MTVCRKIDAPRIGVAKTREFGAKVEDRHESQRLSRRSVERRRIFIRSRRRIQCAVSRRPASRAMTNAG
jgi:deoxyinosine 3'endonuclease (endonuclease V)